MFVRIAWHPADVARRWFSRRWDASRGDQFHSWGAATYFFEVGDDGWPTRHVEIYDDGPTLLYGPDRTEDEYGQLGDAAGRLRGLGSLGDLSGGVRAGLVVRSLTRKRTIRGISGWVQRFRRRGIRSRHAGRMR
jgi:hypothetical protein